MTVDLDALAHPPDPTAAYLSGQRRPSQGPLLDAFEIESAATLEAYHPVLDVPYGPHPRAVFDVYASGLARRGTLVFLHPGYWQWRDKAQFRFLAPAFLARGVDVVLMNYPLCPDVTLSRMVDAVRSGVPEVVSYLGNVGRGGEGLVVAGHSSGAHLAVELGLTDWTSYGLAPSPITGLVPLSGIYELAPLVGTVLNDALRLDAAEARRLSPLHRVRGPLPSALFAVGSLETSAFQAQTEAMSHAWAAEGGAASVRVVEGADHFSLLRALGEGGCLFDPIMSLVDG